MFERFIEFGGHPAVVSGSCNTFIQVSVQNGLRQRASCGKAAGVDEGVVRQQDLVALVHIQPGVVAVGHDVVGGQAQAVFIKVASLVSAQPGVCAAATKRNPDPNAGARYVVGRADHEVALDAAAFAGAFHENAERHHVAVALGKVAHQVVLHAPVVGAHEVKRHHRFQCFAGSRVGQRVVGQQPVVGPVSVVAVDLDVGVEVGDAVVAYGGEGGSAHHMKRVFAIVVPFAYAANVQVLKRPVRAVHQDAFDLAKLKPHGAGLLGAEHDGCVRATVVAQAHFQAEGVQPRRDHDTRARLGLQQSVSNGLRAVYAQFLCDAFRGFFKCGGLLSLAQRWQWAGGRLAFKVALGGVQRGQQHCFQFVVAFQSSLQMPNEFLRAAALRLGHEVLAGGREGKQGGRGCGEQ